MRMRTKEEAKTKDSIPPTKERRSEEKMKRSYWPSHLQMRLDRLQNSCHFGQRAILRATSVSGDWDSFVIQESTSKGLLGTSKVPLLAGRESTWKSRRKEDVVGDDEVSKKEREKMIRILLSTHVKS